MPNKTSNFLNFHFHFHVQVRRTFDATRPVARVRCAYKMLSLRVCKSQKICSERLAALPNRTLRIVLQVKDAAPISTYRVCGLRYLLPNPTAWYVITAHWRLIFCAAHVQISMHIYCCSSTNFGRFCFAHSRRICGSTEGGH